MKFLLGMFVVMGISTACNPDRYLQRDNIKEVDQQREETLDASDVRETDSFYEDSGAESTTEEEAY